MLTSCTPLHDSDQPLIVTIIASVTTHWASAVDIEGIVNFALGLKVTRYFEQQSTSSMVEAEVQFC